MDTGSLFNFNKEAYDALDAFERVAVNQLTGERVVHFGETVINIDKKHRCLYRATSAKWTLFHPREKRDKELADEMGVLSSFKGGCA